jgi:hypothetical protein
MFRSEGRVVFRLQVHLGRGRAEAHQQTGHLLWRPGKFPPTNPRLSWLGVSGPASSAGAAAEVEVPVAFAATVFILFLLLDPGRKAFIAKRASPTAQDATEAVGTWLAACVVACVCFLGAGHCLTALYWLAC